MDTLTITLGVKDIALSVLVISITGFFAGQEYMYRKSLKLSESRSNSLSLMPRG